MVLLIFMTKYNLLNQIGNTPLVDISKYSVNQKVKIYAKLEGGNPGGSIKDRVAWYMIRSGIKSGLVKKDSVLIEPTSGNTGIGMAMVTSILGYKFVAVVPENISIERKKILKAYGASIVETDGKKGSNGSIVEARRIVTKNRNYVMLDQYNNKDNVMVHYLTTGKEIVRDVPNITHFVTGMGTGGTLMGVGRRLKRYNRDIKIFGVEPNENSNVFGLRNMKAYTPPIFYKEKLDGILNVEDDYAYDLARGLIKNNGLSVGVSSGASMWGAIELSKIIDGGVIVTVFPDRADRYISTKLFN